MQSADVDLGTYRTNEGELVHSWYDTGGTLMAEREGPETPVQAGLWSE